MRCSVNRVGAVCGFARARSTGVNQRDHITSEQSRGAIQRTPTVSALLSSVPFRFCICFGSVRLRFGWEHWDREAECTVNKASHRRAPTRTQRDATGRDGRPRRVGATCESRERRWPSEIARRAAARHGRARRGTRPTALSRRSRARLLPTRRAERPTQTTALPLPLCARHAAETLRSLPLRFRLLSERHKLQRAEWNSKLQRRGAARRGAGGKAAR